MQWDISSSPLLLQCTLLQAHKHFDKYPCKILIVMYLTSSLPPPLCIIHICTELDAKQRKKIPREKRQHTSICRDFKYIWEQSVAFLFVLFWRYVREAKIPAMKFSKSVPGSWILLPASFSEKQKRRSRARSSPYPQVLPNTRLPLERSYYKLSDAAFTRVTSTGPSEAETGRLRQEAVTADNCLSQSAPHHCYPPVILLTLQRACWFLLDDKQTWEEMRAQTFSEGHW